MKLITIFWLVTFLWGPIRLLTWTQLFKHALHGIVPSIFGARIEWNGWFLTIVIMIDNAFYYVALLYQLHFWFTYFNVKLPA